MFYRELRTESRLSKILAKPAERRASRMEARQPCPRLQKITSPQPRKDRRASLNRNELTRPRPSIGGTQSSARRRLQEGAANLQALMRRLQKRLQSPRKP